MLEEEPGQVNMATSRRLMQRSRSVLVPGCHVRAVLDEDPGKVHLTFFGCSMQRSRPMLVLG
jgi:hypothetical protein